MPPASSSYLSDSRLKWKKQKRDGSSSTVEPLRKHRKSLDEDHDAEYDEEEDDVHNKDSGGEEDRDLLLSHANHLRQSEVLSESGQKISDFPMAFKRSVIRPHSSVLAVIVAEKWTGDAASRPPVPISLENVSHGQLQVLSSVLPDNPLLNSSSEMEKLDGPPAYVCTPPALLEGKGDVKRSGKDGLLVQPQHSDWFNMDTVHRLERQVVPHFFSGKSVDHTPERYITLRNRIVEKYLENPRRKLSFEDCQDFVSSNEQLVPTNHSSLPFSHQSSPFSPSRIRLKAEFRRQGNRNGMSIAYSVPSFRITTHPKLKHSSSSPSSYANVVIRCSNADGPLRRPVSPAPPPSISTPPIASPPKPASSSQPPVPQATGALTLEFQRKMAKELQDYFKQKKIEEENVGPLFGFLAKNEISNGRWAMFGFAVGLLTEYATGADFVRQLKILSPILE